MTIVRGTQTEIMAYIVLLTHAMDVVLENLSHLNLTGQVEKISSAVQGGGGFYDVYHGKLQPGDRLVAVRELRVYLRERGDFDEKLAREMKIWAGLEHGNILSFLGYSLDFSLYPAFISEWMENGNVRPYVIQNPDVDKMRLVKGIVSGLGYLHDRGIVHSDMKSDNVLISNYGVPLISDLGLSRLLVSSGIVTSTKELVGSLRWIAIEFFVPEYASLDRDVDGSSAGVVGASKETDVWAFGMIVSEILTGRVPYYDMKHEAQIIHAIMSGRHPEPIAIATSESEYSELSVKDEKLWSICRQCWRLHASTRPTMSEVLEQLTLSLGQRSIVDLNIVKKKSILQAAQVRVLVSVAVGRVKNPHVLDQARIKIF